MKAFLVGLLFLIFVVIMAVVGSIAGVLLFPLIIVMGLLLRVAFVFMIVLFAVWLLGKIVIYIWEKLNSK